MEKMFCDDDSTADTSTLSVHVTQPVVENGESSSGTDEVSKSIGISLADQTIKPLQKSNLQTHTYNTRAKTARIIRNGVSKTVSLK